MLRSLQTNGLRRKVRRAPRSPNVRSWDAASRNRTARGGRPRARGPARPGPARGGPLSCSHASVGGVSVEEHRAYAAAGLGFGLITVSDTRAREDDVSGRLLRAGVAA